MRNFVGNKPWGLGAVSCWMASKGDTCNQHGIIKKATPIGKFADGRSLCLDCSIANWESKKTHQNPLLSKCNHCYSPIIWGRTPRGRHCDLIAIDAEPDLNGLIEMVDDEGTPILVEHSPIDFPNDVLRYTEHCRTCKEIND